MSPFKRNQLILEIYHANYFMRYQQLNQKKFVLQTLQRTTVEEVLAITDELEKLFLTSSFVQPFTTVDVLSYQQALQVYREGVLVTTEECLKHCDVQVNSREEIQNYQVKKLFSPSSIAKIAELFSHFTSSSDRNIYFELNGAGQLDGHNLDYTRQCVLKILEQGHFVGLHLGARVEFLEPSLQVIEKIIQEYPNFRNKIIVKIFARIEKYDRQVLQQMFDSLIEVGLPAESVRVGLEHIFSLAYLGLQNPQNADFMRSLQVYEDMLDFCTQNQITRLSFPETRGIAVESDKVFATTIFLLEQTLKKDLKLKSAELHFHNDLGLADQNTLAAAKAIYWLNQNKSTNITPIVDIVVCGGERSGIASQKTISQIFNQDFYTQLAKQVRHSLSLPKTRPNLSLFLSKQTAGTHADLVWNKIGEILTLLFNTDFRREQNIVNLYKKYRRYELILKAEAIADENKRKVALWFLADFNRLVVVASLLLYGHSIRLIYQNLKIQSVFTQNNGTPNLPNLVPDFVPNTPVQGKRNLLLHLLLKGWDIGDSSFENLEKIKNYLTKKLDISITQKFENLDDLINLTVSSLKSKNLQDALVERQIE